MAHKFEIDEDKAGEFRLRFHTSKNSVQNAIDSIRKNGPGAPVEDYAN